jgi:Domain of unknown function (DUF4272)
MSDESSPVDDDAKDPISAPEEVVLTESQRRRKRTIGYLKLWGIETDLSTLSVPLEATSILATTEEIVGKAKVFCLLSLKGQGLTLREVFAFADAYEVWGHVSVAENNYILDEAASETDDVQYAWRYEALNALMWALGHSKHLGFPADASDPAKAVARCMQLILQPSSQSSGQSSGRSESQAESQSVRPAKSQAGTSATGPGQSADRTADPSATPAGEPSVGLLPGQARSPKEILDAADVAFALNAIALSVPGGQPAPADLHRGVVFERALAFRWLLNPAQ